MGKTQVGEQLQQYREACLGEMTRFMQEQNTQRNSSEKCRMMLEQLLDETKSAPNGKSVVISDDFVDLENNGANSMDAVENQVETYEYDTHGTTQAIYGDDDGQRSISSPVNSRTAKSNDSQRLAHLQKSL